MAKRKIALFYDEQTESGKQILDFLTPFAKRKSDIVGELILLWIAEHGTNVPVQWLDRRKGEPGGVPPYFPKVKSETASEQVGQSEKTSREPVQEKAQEPTHDVSMIKAGMASFM